ncbi:MAG: ABC transporter permease [Acidobacteria bacterium]|nr:ABC transporter permease [Acidobacteriota bacterium]
MPAKASGCGSLTDMRPALSRSLIVLVLLMCACDSNYSRKDFHLFVNGVSEDVPGAVVTHEFFDGAAARPYLGRFFTDNSSQRIEVVLSYRVWQRVFRSRPDVIGSMIELDGKAAVIVGVAEPSFAPHGAGELWIPFRSKLV